MKSQRQHILDKFPDENNKYDISLNIVEYLIKNVYLQNKIQFYMNLDTKAFQILLSSIFQKGKLDREKQQFLLSLLKKQTVIVTIALSKQNLNYSQLFLFLQKQEFDYELLNAFQDIYLPYCKKFPQKNKIIKQSFIKNIYTKQIFKILYTTVFCLESRFVEETKEISEIIMKMIVESVFIFSPQHENTLKDNKISEYGQVSYNLKDFLSDLTSNISSVELKLVQRVISYFDGNFIDKMMNKFDKCRKNQLYEDYCQGIICIFISLLKLLETIKLSSNDKLQQNEKKIKIRIQDLLINNAIDLGKRLDFFTSFIIQSSNRYLNYSSGQKIQTVGILKYYTLQLIEKILSVNQIQNLKIDYDSFDFIKPIEIFIQKFKWNNISHNLIVKIFQHLLSQGYQQFRRKHIELIQNYNKSFFSQLVIQFRNKKYIFLHSMHMINHGHRSFIFRLCQNLIYEMQDKRDLIKIIDNFKIWKTFMLNDLSEYETKNYQVSELFQIKSIEKYDITKQLLTKNNELTNQQFHTQKPLETIQKILINFKEEQKWSPKVKNRKNSKETLLEDQAIKKIDSLCQYSVEYS